jgi:hypothetical protein
MQQKARFLVAAEEPEMVERGVTEWQRTRIAIVSDTAVSALLTDLEAAI